MSNDSNHVSQRKIAALVATRNRGASATMAVDSLLANEGIDFELLVIDQSTNDDTRDALKPYMDNPRFRYVRSQTVGLGRRAPQHRPIDADH